VTSLGPVTATCWLKGSDVPSCKQDVFLAPKNFMRPYECVSVWGVGLQIHKFPKMNHVQRIWGSGILKHTHIIFFLFFELLMRQYDAALTMVSWTIHWISTHWHITSIIIIVSFAWQHYVSMATLCLCYCYQVISMYFPKSSRKTRHILELCSFCPDLFQVDQEVIVDRPGSRREVKLAMKMPFRH